MNIKLKKLLEQKGRTKLPNILMVAAECTPFAKTGGLADVVGTLPFELKKLGFDARVMIPYHRIIKEKFGEHVEHICSFSIDLGWRSQYVGLEKLVYNGITFYLIDNEFFFGYGIYKGGMGEGEQYAFFTRAVIDSIPLLDFIPDVLQVNDWHTAMIPMLLKTQYHGAMQSNIKTLLTIHNIEYQGKFPFDFVGDFLHVDSKYWNTSNIECYGCANFLKAGIVFADKISTVSPSYAQEIKYDYYGEGLNGALNSRGDDITGILNGINYETFDPQTDEKIISNYSYDTIEDKYKNKDLLIQTLGLNIEPTTPIFSVVSRLTAQKGLDLLMHIIDEVMRENIAIVVLGTGDYKYESALGSIAYRFPGRVAVRIMYDDDIAHKIYAGSDFYLMPSKFEPCGISQLIAMRYGTLPVVRETGGLKDTVIPYDRYKDTGCGFSFANYNAHELLETMRSAAWVYHDKVVMNKLITNAMKMDYSFAKFAVKYGDLFIRML